jgi:excisionase family DNA binding protein
MPVAQSERTQTQPSRRLASLADSARYADVSARTIRRWISAGLLSGYRAGPRLIRVDLTELDAMLKAIPTTPQKGAEGTAQRLRPVSAETPLN